MAEEWRKLRFRVAGVPISQGSMSGFAVKGKDGKQHVNLTDQKGPKLKPWRAEIVRTVTGLVGPYWEPITGPVMTTLIFCVPRPVSAPKRTRTWPITRTSGDLDKLVRAIFDALTDAHVWKDDAQVVHLETMKDYPATLGFPPGVDIEITWSAPTDRPIAAAPLW